MEWLNYHHLRYFWAAVREGSVTRASKKLRVSQPAVSAQIRALEHAFGEKLLKRSGRQVVPTNAGDVVYEYADEIFGLGAELVETVRRRGQGKSMRLVIGIADVLPKPVVRRLLDPALRLGHAVRLVCREDRPVEEFMGELGLHGLDLLLTDAPIATTTSRAFSHLLGQCGTTLFGSADLARRYRPGFPRSLDGAPALLPGSSSMLRRNLDEWFHARGIRPAVVGEFDDTALMNIFGQDGLGVFPGPTAIERDIERRYGVQAVGNIPSVPHRFYAISVERRLKHPAVVAICERARKSLFA
jgi:LysR family transcriptional activator of nhaA